MEGCVFILNWSVKLKLGKKNQKLKKNLVIVFVALYFMAGFVNYLTKSIQLLSCSSKLKGVYTYLKSFESQNDRLPTNLVELEEFWSGGEDEITLSFIFCSADKNQGYKAYVYAPEIISSDSENSIIMYDSEPRHFSTSKTGFWRSVLLFYYGTDKVRNVLYYNGRIESLTEDEFQSKINNNIKNE